MKCLSRLRAAGQPGQIRRLLLPVPRLSLRHLRPHPRRPSAPQPRGARAPVRQRQPPRRWLDRMQRCLWCRRGDGGKVIGWTRCVCDTCEEHRVKLYREFRDMCIYWTIKAYRKSANYVRFRKINWLHFVCAMSWINHLL